MSMKGFWRSTGSEKQKMLAGQLYDGGVAGGMERRRGMDGG